MGSAKTHQKINVRLFKHDFGANSSIAEGSHLEMAEGMGDT
jgi:hypothetical protein